MNDRICIVTRTSLPKDHMIRFVCGPDSFVTPDLKCNLPGRGCWVRAEHKMLETAVRKNIFSKVLQQEVKVQCDLPSQVDRLLVKNALGTLGLAFKAGFVLVGATKVGIALRQGKAIFLLHSLESSNGEARKISVVLNKYSDEDHKCKIIYKLFTCAELNLALGGLNIVHVVGLASGLAQAVLKKMIRLEQYRQGIVENV